MANSKRDLFRKRRMRVRSKLRKVSQLVPRRPEWKAFTLIVVAFCSTAK